MVKKIILGLLAGFIVFQLLAVSAWNFWLESRHKLVDFELASPISLGGVWVDHENRIWVGYRDTFDVYAGETLQYTFTQTDLLTSPGGLAIDSARGQVWNIATSPEPGVSVFDGATWNLVTTEMPGSYTRARVVDGQGHLWVGSSEGLFVLENGEWRELSAPEPDLPENWVTVLLPGQDDQTWVGTTRGLFLTDGQNWTTFDDSPLDGKMVYAMDVDKNGLLWLGAQDGLY
jgi:ligand-binding sensor domain-containing protein